MLRSTPPRMLEASDDTQEEPPRTVDADEDAMDVAGGWRMLTRTHRRAEPRMGDVDEDAQAVAGEGGWMLTRTPGMTRPRMGGRRGQPYTYLVTYVY